MTPRGAGGESTDSPSEFAQAAAELPGYVHRYSGKVRELYAPLEPDGSASESVLLLVATDRISAFDHVLDTVIPDKGTILTQLSLWWLEQFADVVPSHVLSTEVPEQVAGRAVLVRRLRMVPVECVARAYLTGSGLADYRATGLVCGQRLPAGLIDGSQLPEVLFTPTTKAPLGQHDEPMTPAELTGLVGGETADRLRRLTLQILQRGNELAASRGILIADTKLEFGVSGLAIPGAPSGWAAGSVTAQTDLILADEVLTPDSSRFWPAELWSPGGPQRSYDKQYVRDWLTSPASGWDRSSGLPPPALPDDVVEATRDTYVRAYEVLTGRRFVSSVS